MAATQSRKMGFKIIGNLHLIVAGQDNPTPLDWDLYMTALRDEEKAKGIDATKFRTLAITDGGGPNAGQRKAVSEFLEGRSSPLAIVTFNNIMRGVTVALQWFNPQVRAFSPNQVHEAFKFLDIPQSRYDTLMQVARTLQFDLRLPEIKALEGAIRAGVSVQAHL